MTWVNNHIAVLQRKIGVNDIPSSFIRVVHWRYPAVGGCLRSVTDRELRLFRAWGCSDIYLLYLMWSFLPKDSLNF